MEEGKRRAVGVLTGVLGVVAVVAAGIIVVIKVQEYVDGSHGDGMPKVWADGGGHESPGVSVEEFGCASVRFAAIKKDDFEIIGGGGCERLYADFIADGLVDLCRDVVGEEGRELLRRERANLKLLGLEARYNLRRNSRMCGPLDGECPVPPSSMALRRLLGFCSEGVDGDGLSTAEGKEVALEVRAHWPSGLEEARCKVGGEVVELEKYFASVLLRYLVECKAVEQRRAAEDSSLVMGIGTKGAVDGQKPGGFVILSNGRCMRPEEYMRIVREALFVAEYRACREKGRWDDDEMWLLLQKCRENFEKGVSREFERALCDGKGDGEVEGGRIHVSRKLLLGLLGLTEDFCSGRQVRTRDQDVGVLRHYQKMLSGLVDEKAYYHVLAAGKTIGVRDYMAGLLLSGYRRRVHALGRLLRRGGHRLRTGVLEMNVPMGCYLWFLAKTAHEMESMCGGHEDVRSRVRRLRENLVLCAELVACDRAVDVLDPSTKAVMRLLGMEEKQDGAGAWEKKVRDGETGNTMGYWPRDDAVSTSRCIFNGTEMPVGKYVMGVICEYLDECRARDEAQAYADSRAFEGMNKELLVRYEDGTPVGVEYLGMVRDMLGRVFCSGLEGLAKKALVANDAEYRPLKYYLDCKAKEVDALLSRAFLGSVRKLWVDAEGAPASAIAMASQVMGNDGSFMESLGRSSTGKALFGSILSRLPRRYRGVRCRFGNREFGLARLVAKAAEEYIRKDAVGSHGLFRDLVEECATSSGELYQE